MNRNSAVWSETGSHALSDSETGSIRPVSLTYAFVSTAVDNDLRLFSPAEFQSTRAFLGEGATSTVYKSVVGPLHGEVETQVVAIKQKRRRGSWFDQDVSLESWLRAAYMDMRIMSFPPLQHSKNITIILGYFWEEVVINGRTSLSPCLVMPVANSETPTLEQFFKSHQPEWFQPDVCKKMRLCRAVTNGLSELHNVGIVHGDLKLGNILLFGDLGNFDRLTPKISDFSHSFVMSDFDAGTEKPQYTGTRPFTIPEVRRRDKATFASARDNDSVDALGKSEGVVDVEDFYLCDVFGLGLLLCAILNNGIDMAARAEEYLRRQGLQPDGLLIEDLIDSFCTTRSGVLTECRKSLELWAPELYKVENEDCIVMVDQSLEMCLQDDPKQRSSAAAVLASFSKRIDNDSDHVTQSNPLVGPYRQGLVVPFGKVPTLPRRPYEFMTILSMNSKPQEAALIQSQIFYEASETFWKPTADSAHFVACCYALGLGTDADISKAIKHLQQAAEFGHAGSFLILDRLEAATGYQVKQKLHLVSSRSLLCLDYSERIKQTKAMLFKDGQLMDIVMSKNKPHSHGFSRPTNLVEEDLDEVGDRAIDFKRGFTIGLDKDESVEEIIHKLKELELRFISSGIKDEKTYLKQHLETTHAFQESPFLHAVKFHGMDSSQDSQCRTVHLIKEAEKEEGTDGLEKTNRYGDTPLLLACRNGQALVVRYLISIGADARSTNVRGLTPLHWLGFFGDKDVDDIGRLLVYAGSPLNARTSLSVELDEHSFHLPRNCTPLHFAVAMRNLAAVRALVELGAEVFAIAEIMLGLHEYRLTPLHFAVSLHFHELVEELVRVPGVSSNVASRRCDEADEHLISMVHLIGVHLFMGSTMAPFARWILHGNHYEEAARKTLGHILAVFPQRNVLLPMHHPLSNIALHGQYIWRIFKDLGVNPKMPDIEEKTVFGPDPTALSFLGVSSPAEAWVVAAILESSLAPPSITIMEHALSGFNESQILFSRKFLLTIVEYCVVNDLNGPLSVLFRRSHVRDTLEDVMPSLFCQAASHNAIGVLGVIWGKFVNSATGVREEENRKQYLNALQNSLTPLHSAAQRNAVRAATFLIEKGAPLDVDIGEHGTPLCLAITSSAKECAVLLFKIGANIYCCRARGDGYNVLHASVAVPDLQLLKADQQFSLARTLIEASPGRLISEDARRALNSRDKDGQTPLYNAVSFCDVATVSLLLELDGIDLLAENDVGLTPLMAALLRQHFEGLIGGSVDSMLNNTSFDSTADLGDQAWLGERSGLIAQMLIEAGSPVPEREEKTGAYMFLLNIVAGVLFESSSSPDFETIFAFALKNFDFMKRPSHLTGLQAKVFMRRSLGRVVIFPDGIFDGAPTVELIVSNGDGEVDDG